MARVGHHHQIVISDSEPDDLILSPAYRSRKPISPPPLTRQPSATGQTESVVLNTSTPTRTSLSSSQKSATQDVKGSSLPYWSLGNTKGITHDEVNAPSVHQQQPHQRTPKTQTPKKGDVSQTKIEASLREFSREIGVNHARLTARLIQDAWKRDAPKQHLVSKKDWFAGVKLEPAGPANNPSETMRIKTKVCPAFP